MKMILVLSRKCITAVLLWKRYVLNSSLTLFPAELIYVKMTIKSIPPSNGVLSDSIVVLHLSAINNGKKHFIMHHCDAVFSPCLQTQFTPSQ